MDKSNRTYYRNAMLGVGIGKAFGSKFGTKGMSTAAIIILVTMLFLVMTLLFKKRYFVAFITSIFFVPIIVMYVGIYRSNLVVGLIGVGLIFIMYPIFIYWAKLRDKDKIKSLNGYW